MNFNSIYILLVFSLLQALAAQEGATYPELRKSGKKIDDIIPIGWKILSQASGDLNGDGYKDLAFAIESLEKIKSNYDDGLETDTINTNFRILGIYFGKRNGKFKKTLQSNTFIINRNTPSMEEPFKGLQILPNGVLQIDFYIWPCRECTSWSSHEYRFRFQNKAFELVAYTESVVQRVSGDEVDYSIDFQKEILKIITTTNNEEINEQEHEEQFKKFELPQLKSLKSLDKPFEWEFQGFRI